MFLVTSYFKLSNLGVLRVCTFRRQDGASNPIQNHISAEMKMRGIPQCLRQIQADRHCLRRFLSRKGRFVFDTWGKSFRQCWRANTSFPVRRSCVELAPPLSKIQTRHVHPSYFWHHITTPGVAPRAISQAAMCPANNSLLSTHARATDEAKISSAPPLIRARETLVRS